MPGVWVERGSVSADLAEAVASGVQVPQVPGQLIGVLLGVPGDDAATEVPVTLRPGCTADPPLTNKMVPRFLPRKRMPGTTWCTAATGP